MELARAEVAAGTLSATGWAVGTDPEPYLLAYELVTEAGYVTSRMRVTSDSPSGRRELDLRRSEDGQWTADGDPLPDVAGALDCDLGRSPLTNTMPVLRHGLHQGGEPLDFTMAWISVPDLTVMPSQQRYAFVRRGAGGSTVRYEGRHRSVVADLELDGDGFVVTYPGLATLVASS